MFRDVSQKGLTRQKGRRTMLQHIAIHCQPWDVWQQCHHHIHHCHHFFTHCHHHLRHCWEPCKEIVKRCVTR